MKPVKAQREETFIDEIVETLKSVPKRRLRIVREVVEALAEPSVSDKDAKRAARKSLRHARIEAGQFKACGTNGRIKI